MMEIYCNAKLNLSFDITGTREDGYHLVDTVMQSVDLHDTLTVIRTQGEDIEITSNDPSLPVDERNLVHKAAKLLAETYGVKHRGISVNIKKRIPVEAGLGGGSADAAGALRALRLLWELDVGDDELAALGLELGADIPFCLRGGTARASGIGEVLTPLPPFPACFFVIAMPESGFSTAAAYRLIDEKSGYGHPSTEKLVAAIMSGDFDAAAKQFCSVFETSRVYGESRAMVEKMLMANAAGASMTGSGAAVFAAFHNEGDAAECAAYLKDDYRVFLAKPAIHGVFIGPCDNSC